VAEQSLPVDRDSVAQLLRNRDRAPDEEFVHGAERVTIERTGPGNGPFTVRKRTFEYVVDEPAERGGQDTGPNPLAFFLGGAATCLLSHYMLIAIAEGIEFSSVKVAALGHFNRVSVGGAFRDITYDIRLESEHDAKEIVALAEKAEAMCYAHNTLVNGGVAMTTNVYVNGDLVKSLVK